MKILLVIGFFGMLYDKHNFSNPNTSQKGYTRISNGSRSLFKIMASCQYELVTSHILKTVLSFYKNSDKTVENNILSLKHKQSMLFQISVTHYIQFFVWCVTHIKQNFRYMLQNVSQIKL